MIVFGLNHHQLIRATTHVRRSYQIIASFYIALFFVNAACYKFFPIINHHMSKLPPIRMVFSNATKINMLQCC